MYILYKAYANIKEETVVENLGINIYVMLFSMIATFFLVIFLKTIAKKERSAVLEADSLHYQIDLLTNGGVLVALVAIKITGLHLIDSVVSAFIAVYIIISALKLNFSVTKELLDVVLPQEDIDIIDSILEKHKCDIVDVHKLRTRKAGAQRFIDMHLVLWNRMSLEDANNLRVDIENRIKQRLEDADVNIYIEPCKADMCERCAVCEHGQEKEK